MATVRITRDLTNQITNKVRDQFNVRREAIKAAALKNFEPLKGQYAEDLLSVVLEKFGMPRETYDAIPDGWCHRTRELRAAELNGVHAALLPEITYNPPIKIPENLPCSYLRLEHGRLAQYAAHAFNLNSQLTALKEEETSMMKEVTRLLASCGSLKQALDAWPHLLELLPYQVVAEHNRPTEKRQKITAPKVDTDKLNGSLVKAKMAEAALR
jgi:hypothetical protein